ncbi:MAG: helix-turn-helix domain-containing protein [Treponema sp.]|jgi:excisionase family DNA binding protein|nr:helix-turn-helix domain-containing protein [Treponema sp.]
MIATNVPVEEKKFFTYTEFARLVVTKTTIYRWVKEGYLKTARFSPRCVMIPRSELERYGRGEMMRPPEPGEEKK